MNPARQIWKSAHVCKKGRCPLQYSNQATDMKTAVRYVCAPYAPHMHILLVCDSNTVCSLAVQNRGKNDGSPSKLLRFFKIECQHCHIIQMKKGSRSRPTSTWYYSLDEHVDRTHRRGVEWLVPHFENSILFLKDVKLNPCTNCQWEAKIEADEAAALKAISHIILFVVLTEYFVQ